MNEDPDAQGGKEVGGGGGHWGVEKNAPSGDMRSLRNREARQEDTFLGSLPVLSTPSSLPKGLGRGC
jgi:hypothetical protein